MDEGWVGGAWAKGAGGARGLGSVGFLECVGGGVTQTTTHLEYLVALGNRLLYIVSSRASWAG